MLQLGKKTFLFILDLVRRFSSILVVITVSGVSPIHSNNLLRSPLSLPPASAVTFPTNILAYMLLFKQSKALEQSK